MPKRINNIFYSKIKFRNMMSAFNRTAKGKRTSKEVILFEMNLATNLIEILKEIYYGKYKPGRYRYSTILIPRKRTIMSLPFKDRVVHQWYVEEFLKPIFLPKFINDSYAGINGRGTYNAICKLHKYMKIMNKRNKHYYILKCDISHFFDSINKKILFSIISRYVKDKDFLAFTYRLLYLSDEREIGIPIGNYSSQFFANIYLNELDHYIKEKLKVKYYVRYMDDFVLLVNSKQEAKELKGIIEDFLCKKLNLNFNQKTNYFKNTQGVNFCGCKITHSKKYLNKNAKKRLYATVRKWRKLYKKNRLNYIETCKCLNSWQGYMRNMNCEGLFDNILKKCEWIYR